jgi:polyisoprenoid-binding protein YceI
MSNHTETATGLVTYTADPAHSSIAFVTRHLGFTKVRGTFGDFEAAIRMEPGDLESLETEATIKTESVDTRAADRDTHLRSADFFKTDEFPTLTFRSTGVRDIEGDSFTLVGELTIRDVTQKVELDATFLGEGTDPWGGDRVGFEARTTINRKDYGLMWNQVLEAGGVLVSDTVEIELDIQATAAQDEE